MKNLNIRQFIRKDIASYEEYKAVPSAWDLSMKQNLSIDKVVKLDAGENLFGPSPLVINALSQYKGYQFYPDSEYKQLRQSIGKYLGIDKKYIAVSSGGDEIIDLLLRLTLEVGDTVINCPPTFSTYSLSTVLNRGIVINIPRKSDFSLDSKKIINSIDEKTKVIFICNPNNPTGNVTSQKAIKLILCTGKLVVVDEAYFEFSNETVAPLVKKYSNLVILRSFSKWAGIAGLRLGYGIMSPYLVQQLMKIKQPYNVNVAAEVAALAALNNQKYYKKIIQIIINERERVYKELKMIQKVKVYSSKGNFLFIQTADNTFNKLKNTCEVNNIALRYYDAPLTGKAVRLTIGRPEQNDKVLQIFKNL